MSEKNFLVNRRVRLVKTIICSVFCGLMLCAATVEVIIHLENSVVRLDIEQLGGIYG